MAGDGWTAMPFDQAVQVNPSVPLQRGAVYPFVDMQTVDSGSRSVGPSEMRAFTGGGSRFIAGDTLMARITPCLENGKIARFAPDGQERKGHGSTEFIVIRGRPSVTDNDFAYYLTKWDSVRLYCISQMTGSSGRQRVPTSALSHCDVTIPPFSEQRAIAHILGTLDDKIELNRRMNETLEAIARALFKSWFVEFDPLRAKAEGRKPAGMNAEVAKLFPDSFEKSALGMIPKGWNAGRLRDVAGNPRRGVDPSDVAPKTPYIGLEHMPRRSIALNEWGQSDGVASNKFRFSRGDILFGKLRPYFHKVGIAVIDGVCSTDILVVSPTEPDWFGLVLAQVSSDEFVQYTDGASTGTKMPRTNWNDMARYEIVIPSREVARQFTAIVKSMTEKIRASILQSRTLGAIRDALLPKLLSGQIRVKDAEEFVEASL